MALLDHLFPGRGTKWPCNDLIFPGSKNEMPPLANELHFLAGQHITGLYLSQGQHTTELHRSAVLGRQDGQLRPTRDMNMPHGTVLEEPVVPVKPLGVRAGINKPVTSVVCLDLVGVVAETIAHPHAAEQEGLLGLGLLVVLVDLRGLRARRSVVVAVLSPDVALDCADITSAERALGNSVVPLWIACLLLSLDQVLLYGDRLPLGSGFALHAGHCAVLKWSMAAAAGACGGAAARSCSPQLRAAAATRAALQPAAHSPQPNATP